MFDGMDMGLCEVGGIVCRSLFLRWMGLGFVNRGWEEVVYIAGWRGVKRREVKEWVVAGEMEVGEGEGYKCKHVYGKAKCIVLSLFCLLLRCGGSRWGGHVI